MVRIVSASLPSCTNYLVPGLGDRPETTLVRVVAGGGRVMAHRSGGPIGKPIDDERQLFSLSRHRPRCRKHARPGEKRRDGGSAPSRRHENNARSSLTNTHLEVQVVVGHPLSSRTRNNKKKKRMREGKKG